MCEGRDIYSGLWEYLKKGRHGGIKYEVLHCSAESMYWISRPSSASLACMALQILLPVRGTARYIFRKIEI